MVEQQFDPPLKALVETEPESWPAFLGRPVGPTTVIDADIATISGAADKVLHVAAESPYLLHLEFVSGHDAAALPGRLNIRNGLLNDRHNLHVRRAVILLRPESDSPQLSGLFQQYYEDEEMPYRVFRYQVIRVWEIPPQPLLAGRLGTLPLAVISAVTPEDLPGLIQQIDRRLKSRRARLARQVWGAAFILTGLRYSREFALQLFRGVLSMRESTTYQLILEEGMAKGIAEGRAEGALAEARKAIRIAAEPAFGPLDSASEAVLEQLNDLRKLEAILRRVRNAEDWRDLLHPRRRRPS